MSLCFICNSTLYGKSTQVCSSITPYSETTYPEKIASLLGDEFVIIVTPTDRMCLKCTSLLNHLDKCETEGQLVEEVLVSNIKIKYKMVPPNHPIQDVEIVNGHLKTKKQLEEDQHKLDNGWIVGDSSTATTSAVVTQIKTPLNLFKTQQYLQQQEQEQQEKEQQERQRQQQQQQSTNKNQIYKCGFCMYQSKELAHVRFHMLNHKVKKEPKIPMPNQPATKTLTSEPKQKKQLYRCQTCSKTYDNRVDCVVHVKEAHNKPTTSTSNGARETKENSDKKLENKTENAGDGEKTENSQEDTTAEEEKSVQKHEPAQEEAPEEKGEDKADTAVPEQEKTDQETPDSIEKEVGEDNVEVENKTENAGDGEKTENSQKDTTAKEDKSVKNPELAQETVAEEGGEDKADTAAPEQEKTDQETPDSIEKEVGEDNAKVENKTSALDVELMLAAIHGDNPPTNRDTQNKA